MLPGDRDGHLVVTALHAEVTGEPAAPGNLVHLRPGGDEQPGVGLPAEDGPVVAVRLDHHPGSGQRRWLPALGAFQQLGQGDRLRGQPVGRRGVEQVEDIVAQHRRAGRFQPENGHPRLQLRADDPQGTCEPAPCPVELSGADPGDPAAHRGPGQAHLVPGGPQHRHGGPAHPRGEVLGELVHPQQHRPAGGGPCGPRDARAPVRLRLPLPGEPGPQPPLGERGQTAPPVHPGRPPGEYSHHGCLHHGIGDPRGPARQARPHRQPAQRVVGAGPDPVPVRLVQHLRPEPGQVDPGRALARAGLARQAQVEGRTHLR